MKDVFSYINSSKPIFKVILLVNILILVYFIILAYYNRLATDDNTFSIIVKENGIVGFVDQMYSSWQGRFTGFFALGFFYKLFHLTESLFYGTVILSGLGIFSILRLFKTLLPDLRNGEALNIAFLFFNILVLSAFDFHTFFWLCATIYYLVTFALILLLTELISKKRNFISYFLIAFFSFYIGGAAEHIGSVFIVIAGLVALYIYYQNKFKASTFYQTTFQKLLVSILFTAIAFLILFAAPGNESRKIYFEQPSVLMFFPYSIIVFVKLLIFITIKSYYFLFLFPIAFLLGNSYQKLLNHDNTYHADVFQKISIKWLTLILLAILYLSVLPGVYAISDIFPVRAGVHISFLVLLYVGIIGFVFGLRSKKTPSRKVFVQALGALSILAFLVISFIIRETPRVKKYAESDKKRIEFLIQKKNAGNESLLELEPLFDPSYENSLSKLIDWIGLEKIKNYPGLRYRQMYYREPLNINEISEDQNEWRNTGIKNAYKLPFDVKIKPGD
jgi:hypothetical protein